MESILTARPAFNLATESRDSHWLWASQLLFHTIQAIWHSSVFEQQSGRKGTGPVKIMYQQSPNVRCLKTHGAPSFLEWSSENGGSRKYMAVLVGRHYVAVRSGP